MSEFSYKCKLIQLHAMNFITAVITRGLSCADSLILVKMPCSNGTYTQVYEKDVPMQVIACDNSLKKSCV